VSAPLTILGSGHAGITLARDLRKLAPDLPLRLITREDGHYYYKPDLSKAFAAGKDADGLIKNPLEQLVEQLKAEVLVRKDVTAIDTAAHAVQVDGAWLPYSKLVLATGADVLRLPIAGDAAAEVLSVNDREDYARFRAVLKPGARVLIIGAGLIGCEFANDLAAGGYAVRVVDIAGWPLNRLLPEAQGRALQEGLGKLGVTWQLGSSVASLDRVGGAIEARFSDDSRATVDVVLSAVGLRPRIRLAAEAGLACKTGIVVDDHLQTSAADVYAIGDCIEINGRLLPYILPIANASRALAATLAGTPTKARFPAMPVIVKTPACPTLVNPPPPVAGSWEVTGTAPDLEAVYKDADGKPLGFALTGAATSKRGQYVPLMPAVHEPA
jgi:rubredoxin-NAD+ reductase